jgi:AcrR family transcriptional regulator
MYYSVRKECLLPTGRPREFDLDQALDAALNVFWRKGFEGATLPDLTEAMGINRPSLYAAFGNKETLFLRAMDRYSEGPERCMAAALALPTAREVVEQLLRGAAKRFSDPDNPAGCFMVQGALACGDSADPMRREMAARRNAAVEVLRKRFKRAIAEGDLPADAHAGHLARYVATILHGLSVQAAGGATRKEMQGVVEIALRAWPA